MLAGGEVVKTDSWTQHSLGWWRSLGFQGLIYAGSDRRLGSKIITQLGAAIPVACLNNLTQIIRRRELAHPHLLNRHSTQPASPPFGVKFFSKLAQGGNMLLHLSISPAASEKFEMEKLRCDWIGGWGGFHGANWQYVSKLSGHYPNMGRDQPGWASPPCGPSYSTAMDPSSVFSSKLFPPCRYQSRLHGLFFWGRVRTAKSAYKSAFLGTLRSAFTRKSAFQSAQKSAKNSVAPKRVL